MNKTLLPLIYPFEVIWALKWYIFVCYVDTIDLSAAFLGTSYRITPQIATFLEPTRGPT